VDDPPFDDRVRQDQQGWFVEPEFLLQGGDHVENAKADQGCAGRIRSVVSRGDPAQLDAVESAVHGWPGIIHVGTLEGKGKGLDFKS